MRNSEATRSYIIETAAPIFNKNGYIGTSLSEILKQTPLTKGAIYHHFENKDDLALAALDYNLKFVSERIFSSVKEKTHSCDKLTVFAEAFKKNYEVMKQMGGCPVMNAAVDSDDGNELIKKRISLFIKIWEKTLNEIINQGKSKNEIRQDIDTESFSMNFISIIEGSIAMSKATEEKKFIDSAVGLVKFLIEKIRS